METGTVIHGTLRPEDLVPAFIAALDRQERQEKQGQHLIVRTYRLLKDLDYGPVYARCLRDDLPVALTPCAHELVDKLIDELNNVAPEGYYFGAHPGDGSDFGYWPVELLDW